MIYNYVENIEDNVIRRFVFLDNVIQQKLSKVPSNMVETSIILAIDYLFPALTEQDRWIDRDFFPYKYILSFMSELLYHEVYNLKSAYREDRSKVAVMYLGDLILLDLKIEVG